ncbi:hypothetical protein WJ968_27205 [Achromobacter xylosoxidans]
MFDSLSSNGGLLAPEFVSHNADKVTEIFDGQKNGKILGRKGFDTSKWNHFGFFLDFAWKKRVSLKVQVVSVIHSGILKIKLFRGYLPKI